MRTLEVNGKTIKLTPDGFLQDPEKWDPCVMEALIAEYESEGNPPVDPIGRMLIRFMRDYYEDNQVHPSLNRMLRMWDRIENKRIQGREAFRDLLFEMFPRGPIPALARLAGLPEPPVEEEFDAG